MDMEATTTRRPKLALAKAAIISHLQDCGPTSAPSLTRALLAKGHTSSTIEKARAGLRRQGRIDIQHHGAAGIPSTVSLVDLEGAA